MRTQIYVGDAKMRAVFVASNIAYISSSFGIAYLGFFFEGLTGGLLFKLGNGAITECSTQEGSGADSNAAFFLLSLLVVPSVIRLLRFLRPIALGELFLITISTLLVFLAFLGNTCGDLGITSQANDGYFLAFRSFCGILFLSVIVLVSMRLIRLSDEHDKK